MLCRACGKTCTDDYILMPLYRFKDGELHSVAVEPTILCVDCYEEIVHVTNKNFEKDEEGTDA